MEIMPALKHTSQEPIGSTVYKSQRKYQNFSLSNISLSQTSTSSPSDKYPSLSSSIGRLKPGIDQIYNSFQFKDQVTFQKINVRNLQRSCQQLKSVTKSRKYAWTEQLYEQEKENHINNMENLMIYIEEMRVISARRNNQLVMTWRNREKQKKKEDLKNKILDTEQNQIDKVINIRNSIQKKIKQEKRVRQKMKQKIVDINVQQFRNYYHKKQPFNPKSHHLLKIPLQVNMMQHLDQLQNENLAKQKRQKQKNLKKDREIKNKLRQQYDLALDKEAQEINQLIKIRIRHQTQYNWQN